MTRRIRRNVINSRGFIARPSTKPRASQPRLISNIYWIGSFPLPRKIDLVLQSTRTGRRMERKDVSAFRRGMRATRYTTYCAAITGSRVAGNQPKGDEMVVEGFGHGLQLAE